MRALLPFLACLMLVLTSMTSIAHATEAPDGGVSIAEMAAWHSPGDADEVQGDPDKDAPHHHSICHGHDLAASAKGPAAPMAYRVLANLRPEASTGLSARMTDTPLRPPIA